MNEIICVEQKCNFLTKITEIQIKTLYFKTIIKVPHQFILAVQ